jgi:hypothetical protein
MDGDTQSFTGALPLEIKKKKNSGTFLQKQIISFILLFQFCAAVFFKLYKPSQRRKGVHHVYKISS